MAQNEDSQARDYADLSSRMSSLERRYRTLIDNVDVGICIAKMKFDDNLRAVDYFILDGNSAYERHTGLYGTVGRWVSDFAPDLERAWFDTYGNVALTGTPARFELQAVPLGNRWFEVEAHRVGNPEDFEVAILFTDVTDKRAERESLQTINRELAHRMKNFVSIVQSMISQTLRRSVSTQDAQKSIEGRLLAFARAQDLLGDEILNGADILPVVLSSISPHQTQDERIKISGDAFALSARRALALSLALHELATNSIKYGALSNEVGQVDLTWQFDDNRIDIFWRESGGPHVVAPTSRGFGTRLIEIVGANFDGISHLEFAPDGLVFHLSAPTRSSTS